MKTSSISTSILGSHLRDFESYYVHKDHYQVTLVMMALQIYLFQNLAFHYWSCFFQCDYELQEIYSNLLISDLFLSYQRQFIDLKVPNCYLKFYLLVSLSLSSHFNLPFLFYFAFISSYKSCRINIEQKFSSMIPYVESYLSFTCVYLHNLFEIVRYVCWSQTCSSNRSFWPEAGHHFHQQIWFLSY